MLKKADIFSFSTTHFSFASLFNLYSVCLTLESENQLVMRIY